MGSIVGGILGARLLLGLASGIRDIGVNAIEATASVQRMQITLESLLGREYITKSLAGGWEQINLMDQGVTNLSGSIKALWMTEPVSLYEEALSKVQVPAARLMETLAQYAILSPYTYESVTQTFRQAMAFGFAADEADEFTQATLNMAAGIGADNSMLDRMAYNLAQIRLQGKVTALDIRQLALAGFDLRSVLRYVGKEMGVNVDTHLDFNRAIANGSITWADFSRLYAQYADTYFGGASERLARSLFGLKSTFQDVFALTMPKLLGPAAEEATVFLNSVLNSFISLRESNVLEEVGVRWGESMRKWVTNLQKTQKTISNFMLNLKMGRGLTTALINADIVSPEVALAIERILDALGELRDRFNEVKASLPSVNLWNAMGTALIFVADNITLVGIALGALTASRMVGTLLTVVSAILHVAAGILNPITLILAAVGYLYLAWENNWFGIRDILMDVWNSMPGVLSQFASSFESIKAAVLNAWSAIQPTFTKIGEIFQTVVAEVSPMIQLLAAELGERLPGLIAVGTTMLQTIGPVLKAVFDGILPSIQRLWTTFKNLWPQIVGMVGWGIDIFKYLGIMIGGVVVLIIGIITGLVNGIISGVSNAWAGIMAFATGIRTALAGIGQIFKGLWDIIVGLFTRDAEKMWEGLKGLGTGILNLLTGLFQAVVGIIAAPLGFIIGLISGFVEGVIGFFVSLYNSLVGHSIIPDLINGILNWFIQLGDFIRDILQIALNGILTALQSIANVIVVAVQTAIETFITTLQNLWTEAERIRAMFGEQLANAIQRVREKIMALINKVLELIGTLARVVMPNIFKEESPSPFAQSMMNASEAIAGLIDKGQDLNALKFNLPPSQPFGGVSGNGLLSGEDRSQANSRVVNFYFNDTTLDLTTLAYAMNRIQDV